MKRKERRKEKERRKRKDVGDGNQRFNVRMRCGMVIIATGSATTSTDGLASLPNGLAGWPGWRAGRHIGDINHINQSITSGATTTTTHPVSM